jgi:transcriptional regulator with XRE-family HTH domain
MKRNRYSSQEEVLRKILRCRRLEIGMRQEDLAEKLSAQQSFVSKYESGERLLTFVETINICKVLDLAPTTLIKEYLLHYES